MKLVLTNIVRKWWTLMIFAALAVAVAWTSNLSYSAPPNPPVYVPFKSVASLDTTVCAAAGTTDWDSITVRSLETSGQYLVTSIIFSLDGIDQPEDEVRIHNIQVDTVGTGFETLFEQGGELDLTGSFTGSPSHGETLFRMEFEVLGAPFTGGNIHLPHEIVVTSGLPSADLSVTIACKAVGTKDITWTPGRTMVSGWKQASDTIEVVVFEAGGSH